MGSDGPCWARSGRSWSNGDISQAWRCCTWGSSVVSCSQGHPSGSPRRLALGPDLSSWPKWRTRRAWRIRRGILPTWKQFSSHLSTTADEEAEGLRTLHTRREDSWAQSNEWVNVYTTYPLLSVARQGMCRRSRWGRWPRKRQRQRCCRWWPGVAREVCVAFVFFRRRDRSFARIGSESTVLLSFSLT